MSDGVLAGGGAKQDRVRVDAREFGFPADELVYKPDWPQARQRFLAFWEHEIVDRACVSVTARREEWVPAPQASDPEAKFTDIDYWLAFLNATFRNTYYAGEAIPALGSSLGFAVFGGEPQFREDTIWIDPIIDDWDSFSYRLVPGNKWCQRFLEFKRLNTWTVEASTHRRWRVHCGPSR